MYTFLCDCLQQVYYCLALAKPGGQKEQQSVYYFLNLDHSFVFFSLSQNYL